MRKVFILMGRHIEAEQGKIKSSVHALVASNSRKYLEGKVPHDESLTWVEEVLFVEKPKE